MCIWKENVSSTIIIGTKVRKLGGMLILYVGVGARVLVSVRDKILTRDVTVTQIVTLVYSAVRIKSVTN